MWPPTTSRILEPPDCLPGLFWGHFKRQNAASNVSDHVCSVWDCENFSKLGKSWKQKPFWPRLRKKGAGARRLPLLFSHQPMRGQHVCLSVPLNKKNSILVVLFHRYGHAQVPIMRTLWSDFSDVELGRSWQYDPVLPLPPQPSDATSFSPSYPSPPTYYYYYYYYYYYLSSSLSSHFALPSWPSTPPWTTSSPSSTSS